MKSLVIFPSIRATENFGKYAANFTEHGHSPDVMVIDETVENREDVKFQFAQHDQFNIEFFGIEERHEWFKAHGLGDSDDIIPQRAHNETSFGLLVALTRDYDMILFVDDDTYPEEKADFLGEHLISLNSSAPLIQNYRGCWVNTHSKFFARGFPYNQRAEHNIQTLYNCEEKPVLNMGLWSGIPDLNAIDYLQFGMEWFKSVLPRRVALTKNQFAPICSMNMAFKPEVIPAFYQLWHRDRYDDIFSGLFLKKIADHLGEHLRVGNPVCVHDKAPRNLFDDIRAELQGMELNEELWKILLEIELDEESWLGCYRELAEKLYRSFQGSKFDDYVWVMTQKMRLWTDVVERLM